MTTPPHGYRPMTTLVQLLVAVMGLAGIFLPFTGGFSPFTALKEFLAPTLAGAAFISPLITVLALRLLTRGSLTWLERGLAWLGSVSFLAFYCWGWYVSLAVSNDPSGLSWGGAATAIILFLPLLLLFFGCWMTVRAARHQGLRTFAPILALRTMYVVNATFALSALFGSWQIGAWAILVAASGHVYLMVPTPGR